MEAYFFGLLAWLQLSLMFIAWAIGAGWPVSHVEWFFTDEPLRSVGGSRA